MSKACKCDMCGKLYEASPPYPDLRLYRGQYPHIDQLDLCDECQEKLERFVGGAKTDDDSTTDGIYDCETCNLCCDGCEMYEGAMKSSE